MHTAAPHPHAGAAQPRNRLAVKRRARAHAAPAPPSTNPGEFPACSAMPAAIPHSASPVVGGVGLDLEDIARAADAHCIGALACGRASFSYHRLPEPRLRLTIRKLDDSYFDVQIARSAAVWELKAAIEAVFIALYDDMENAISWQHVWSHFCLCFKDQKLTDDKATLRAFGIKDGDELHFAQHLSVDYSPCKSSRSQRAASHRRSRTSLDDFSVRSRTLLNDIIKEDEGNKKLTATSHLMSVLEEGFCVLCSAWKKAARRGVSFVVGSPILD